MKHIRIKYNNLPICISVFLLLSVIFTQYCLSGIYARYTTSDKSHSDARVAAFVFSLHNGENSRFADLKGISKPGDSQNYTFTVTNSDNNITSEVSETYSIKLSIEGNMPLICTLKNADTDEILLTVVSSENQEEPVSFGEINEIARFPAGAVSENHYIVTAVWPQEKNDSKYACGSATADLKLTVIGQQTD